MRNLNTDNIISALQERVDELESQPEHRWENGEAGYATDAGGRAAFKVGVANCTLDFDLWKGLRNPAALGLHPVGLEQIWEYYAGKRVDSTDETGRRTMFRVPKPYAVAQEMFGRAVIISVQLPFSPSTLGEYAEVIREGRTAPDVNFGQKAGELSNLLDGAVTRLAYNLIDGERAVIPMNSENVRGVTEEAVPATHKGSAHGPSKGGNYPQKSVAVLTGLGQFGLSRLVMRDELVDGEVRRFIGPLRSLVVFDTQSPVRDGSVGVLNLTEKWRSAALQLADFTNNEQRVDQYRFCTGVSDNPCSACIEHCPPGALANSAPGPDGQYAERVARQRHRFSDGELQFDHATCCDDRGQMASLYDGWVCGRCLCMCGHAGRRRRLAAENFEKLQRMPELLADR